MKILVLEHEPIVAQALKLLLSSAAYEVEIARVCECGDEADLGLANPGRYDLIVLDAGADSAVLGHRLRSQSPAKGPSQPLPPILLLTGSAQSGEAWATEILVKPVEAVDLVARVKALLEPSIATARPVVEQVPASAAQLSCILDSAIAAIYSFRVYGNGNWEYDYWSAGCERLFGFPRSAYVDKHFWLSRVHPDDRGQVLRPLRDIFLAAGDAQVEYRFYHQDGSLRWFSSAYSSQKIADNAWLVTTVSHDITDRKQSEAALRASEEKYRLLFESMDEGFCLIEMIFDDHSKPIDYRFLEINPSFEQQTGLVEAQGKRIRELMPNIEASWAEIFGQVWRTGEPIRFENHAAEIHSWFDVFAFRFGAVECHQVALLFRNVTERHQAEIALQESERKLRAVFDSTFEFMGLLKADGTVVDANRTALMAIACDLAAVVGQPFWQTPWWAHFPEQRQRLRAAIDQAAQGNVVQMETQHIWADGSLAWVDFSIKPVVDEEGQVVMLVPEGRDITGRKTAERKIREQAALLDIASDAITVRDLDHRLLYWNQGAERLYGFEAASALGHKSYDLLRSETAQYSEMMPTLLEQGEWRGELTKFTKANQAVTVAARWTLVNDEAGRPKFILSVETDITGKKALEAQFYQAQRLESLGRLASGIAHDLNNVFTPILTISQLLRLTQRHLSVKAQDQLRLLEESAKRGATMVQQILSITRSSSDTRTEVDLEPLLRDLGDMLEQSLPPHIILQMPKRGEAKPLWVSADPTHLHQVLMNLCVNARDAMPEGGTLTVSAESVMLDAAMAQTHLDAQVGLYVRLTVADTGTGIDPSVRDRIFDPFFTTKVLGQGTGLGLAMVLGLVKASSGFIQVISAVGQGTQMQVYLPALVRPPASDAADGAGPDVDGPDAPPQGQGELLLVVEDDASVQHSLRSLLFTYNYSILFASNGFEALDCYAEHWATLRLVVIDIMMPGMDGITLIQRLKVMQPSVKIIATSGLPTYQAAALVAGASDFLLKPYDLSDLLKTIARLLYQA